MKIISYGHIEPKLKFCSKCGAEFEYTPADIISVLDKFIIRCPVCGNGTIRRSNIENEHEDQ